MDRFERLSTNLVSSFMEEWFSFCIISQNDTCSYSGKRIMPIILSWAVMLLLYLASHLVVNASFCSVIQREKSQLETEFQTNSLRFWTGMLSTMFSTIIQYQAIFFLFFNRRFQLSTWSILDYLTSNTWVLLSDLCFGWTPTIEMFCVFVCLFVLLSLVSLLCPVPLLCTHYFTAFVKFSVSSVWQVATLQVLSELRQ